MIRRWMARLLSMAKRMVDDTVPEVELHAYLRKRLLDLERALQSGAIPAGDERLARVLDCTDRLHRLGFATIPAFTPPLERHRTHPVGEVHDSKKPIVSGGRIEGEVVNELYHAADREGVDIEAQLAHLEALLRHIEVRRKTGLHFIDSSDGDARWGAVCRISVVFSRFARQGRDYRYLNVALKLNDWAYRYYRSVRALQSSLPYVHAILEAEATLLEMTS